MQTHLTVKGVVVRETAYGESDKLFDLLTDSGVLTVRARGVRKQGSKYAAVTQLFSYGEFCLRERGGRHYLDSAVSIEMFYGIRGDLLAFMLGSYFAEVIIYTATLDFQPQILRLFLYCLHYLSARTRPLAMIKAVFELRMMTELGMQPDLSFCAVCAEPDPLIPLMRCEDGDFICDRCTAHAKAGRAVAVPHSALQAARHIADAPLEKLFLFRLEERSLARLGVYTETYLLQMLDTSFRTLRVYKDMVAEGMS